MAHAFEQLQRLGQALLRARGFARREERTASGRRFFLYERRGNGSGPAAVLVHGLGGSATSFLSIASGMCALSRRVLLIDLPGYGQAALEPHETPASPLELSEALGRTLELLGEPALLVGNSLGGALVLGSALLWPAQVAGVIGLAPAGAPFSEAEAAEVRRIFRGGAESGPELGRRLFRQAPWVVRLFSRGLGENIADRAVQHIVGSIRAGEQVLTEAELRTLRVPALVMWCDADAVLPASGAEYFRRVLPSGSFEMFERSGHLPQMERPRAVLQRISRFIEALPPRARR